MSSLGASSDGLGLGKVVRIRRVEAGRRPRHACLSLGLWRAQTSSRLAPALLLWAVDVVVGAEFKGKDGNFGFEAKISEARQMKRPSPSERFFEVASQKRERRGAEPEGERTNEREK